MSSSPDTTISRVQALREGLLGLLPERWRSGRRRLALAGTSWALLGQGGTQVLRLVSTLVLARLLLSPEAFGLVALVNVFLTALEMMSDLGLWANAVQHAKGDTLPFLRTAFTVQLVRGAALGGIAALLAFPYASCYALPELGPLTLVAAAALPLRALSSPELFVLNRNVAVRPVTLLTLGSELAGLVVSVAIALAWPSAWALVVGALVAAAVYALLSHVIAPRHIRPGWDAGLARDILSFGSWAFASTGALFLAAQGERFLLGAIASAASLGCYALAASISTAPQRLITQTTSFVVYPLISAALREERSKGLRNYVRTRNLYTAAGLLLGVALFVAGPLLARALLGPQYAAVGWMIQLLGIRAAWEIAAAPVVALLLALGVPAYAAGANAGKFIIAVGGLLLLSPLYDLKVVVAFLVLAPLIAHVGLLYGVRRKAGEVLRAEVISLLAPAVLGLLLLGFEF